MRIMTSNIWGDYFGNPVEEREQLFIDVFSRYDPDVIGFQEVTVNWYHSKLFDWVCKNYFLAGSEYFAPGTIGKIMVGGEYFNCTNYTIIAYKRDKFELYEKGMERYFNTPDTSKVVTWVVLRDVGTNKVFGVCNTHLWWKRRGEYDDELREKNAHQLASVIKHLSNKFSCPVFSLGDFNSLPAEPAYQYLMTQGIDDLQVISPETTEISSHHGDPQRGEDGMLHGKRTTDDKSCSIDHINAYGNGYKPLRYCIVEDREALDASDHSPVYADFELL